MDDLAERFNPRVAAALAAATKIASYVGFEVVETPGRILCKGARHGLCPRSAMKHFILVSTLLACGGTSTPQQTHTAADDSPAAKCLAVAGAKREPKADEPSRITVKHVLVKWSGSKNAPAEITRTREQACLRALEAHAKLEGGATFADVVKGYSDEPGAITREGLVGQIERRDVLEPFADAAFELARGEVSQVVETKSGFHIILRSE